MKTNSNNPNDMTLKVHGVSMLSAENWILGLCSWSLSVLNCGCDEVSERSWLSYGCDDWLVFPWICGGSDVCERCWSIGVLQRSWVAPVQVTGWSLEEAPRRPALLEVWPADRSLWGEVIERPFPADLWYHACTVEEDGKGWGSNGRRVMTEVIREWVWQRQKGSRFKLENVEVKVFWCGLKLK